MGNTPLPNNGGLLIGLATKMHGGIADLGTSIPITMLTAAELQTSLDLFTIQDTLFNTARSLRLEASVAFQATMDNLYTWLLAARKVVAVNLGDQWSTTWAQAGFINNSTAIPAKIQERLGLILNLITFFTANPGFEAPTLNVTIAQATLLQTAALAAQRSLTTATQALKTAHQSWTAAYDELTALMRTLIRNLQGKLSGNDPRWLAFGLQMPATNSTPGKPLNVTVQPDQSGTTLAHCERVPLATRYRFRMLLVGVESDYRLVRSSKEPIVTLPAVMPGQTIQVIVQAVNGNLQGVASDPVRYTVLLPVAQPVVTPSIAPSASSRNGHGSNGHGSNGHGNATELAPRGAAGQSGGSIFFAIVDANSCLSPVSGFQRLSHLGES